LLCFPLNNQFHSLTVSVKSHKMNDDGLEGKVKFKVTE